MATLELIHEINPTGQKGIWKHSQNVEDDLLKRFVVQVRTVGWLAMKSFDNEFDAGAYCISDKLLDLFPANSTVRVWDDKAGQAIYTIIGTN